MNKYVDPQLLIECRNYRTDFMQVLGSVPAGTLITDGVRRNRLTSNVGLRVNSTGDSGPKQMAGKNYIVPWEIHDMESSLCADDEIHYFAFDKRAAIHVKHDEAFQVGIRNHVLYKLAPEDDSSEEMLVIRTTGEKDINGCLKLSCKDLVDFTTLVRTWNLPVADALYMMLSPLHISDLLPDKDASKCFYDRIFYLDPATGKPKGFTGIKFFESNDCPFYNVEIAKGVAKDAKPSAKTDLQTSMFLYAPNTYYHTEPVKSLYRPGTTDTCSKNPVSEYRTQTYSIVNRVEDLGVDVILPDKSA